jgi:hypothetical protein
MVLALIFCTKTYSHQVSTAPLSLGAALAVYHTLKPLVQSNKDGPYLNLSDQAGVFGL